MEKDNSLLYACYSNDLDLIRERLKSVKPTQLKQTVKEIGTPLHASAMNENEEAVDLLLEAGADLEAGNFLGNNAMLDCIEHGKLNMAKYLIEKGSNINKKGLQNRNALSQLILYSWNRDFAKYLLEHGCSITATSRDKSSLLNDAASSNNEDAINFLLEHGIDRSSFNSALCWSIIHNSTDAVSLLLDKGGDLDEMYDSCKGIEKSLYHIVATRKNYDKLLKLLLEHGVNFKQVPSRAVSLGIGKTKLSPYEYTKEHLEKWPNETYLLEHIKLMELY